MLLEILAGFFEPGEREPTWFPDRYRILSTEMSRLRGGQAQDPFFAPCLKCGRTAKKLAGVECYGLSLPSFLGVPPYKMGGTGYTCVESSNRCLGSNMLNAGPFLCSTVLRNRLA